jgi:hypothetical protein
MDAVGTVICTAVFDCNPDVVCVVKVAFRCAIDLQCDAWSSR